MTGCVFYIVDAFLDFGLEHNRNLNELVLYFLFYYLDSFSLINFRSVSCGEGSLSPLWQMSQFRRSGGEKKWQDSSWDPCHCHCRRKKSRAPTLCKTFQYTVHELALLSKRQCVRHFPIFRTLVPSQWLRNKNYFTSDHFVQPIFLQLFAPLGTIGCTEDTVQVSEYQCNLADDGCFWDLSFIHSLNLRSKAFRNSAWEQGDAIYPFLPCFFLALTGALCMACSGVTIFLGIYRVSQKKSVF